MSKNMIPLSRVSKAVWDELNVRVRFAAEKGLLCESYIDATHYAIDTMADVAYGAEFIELDELQEIKYVNDTLRAECIDILIEHEELERASKSAAEDLEWVS